MAHATWSACFWCHSQDTPWTQGASCGRSWWVDSASKSPDPGQAWPSPAMLCFLDWKGPELPPKCCTGWKFGVWVGAAGWGEGGSFSSLLFSKTFQHLDTRTGKPAGSWAVSRCLSPPNRISPVKWMRTPAPGRLPQTAVPLRLPWSACQRLCPQRGCLPHCMQLDWSGVWNRSALRPVRSGHLVHYGPGKPSLHW